MSGEAKSNAKQAMRELFGGRDTREERRMEPEEQPAVVEEAAIPVAETTVTVIDSGTTVRGNVESSNNIEVYGTIYGDVSTTSSIKVCGKVVGNLRATGIILIGCRVKGDVCSDTLLTMDKEALVDGNIQAENVSIDGRVRGDLNVRNMTELKTNALVLGDVHTTRFSMKDGTRLVGGVSLTCSGAADKTELEKEFSFS